MLAFSACRSSGQTKSLAKTNTVTNKGQLFIIGGGKRSPEMIKKLVALAGIEKQGYGIILPMSSAEPDSAVYYAKMQFEDLGMNNIVGMNFEMGDIATSEQLDSLRNAPLIYISGGDQNRFMDIVQGTMVETAILEAYKRGSVIAGTSAGAAVMSEKMITGNELKHLDYESTFRNIEPDNIEIKKGLGLIKSAIIDQHFVKRSRYNRLLSAVIEHPDMLGIGIDESTAIVVNGDSAEVIGDSQVILFRNTNDSKAQTDDLLGAKNLSIDILLPGTKFVLVR